MDFQSRPPSSSSGRIHLPASGRTGVVRALEAGLEFRFETLVLFRRHVALAARVDEGAGRTGGIVEQRLVPGRRRIVQVDGGGGGLDLIRQRSRLGAVVEACGSAACRGRLSIY